MSLRSEYHTSKRPACACELFTTVEGLPAPRGNPAQFAVDDATLPNELKLGFHLRTTDPHYAAKKLRFPPHMIEAKKLYAELACAPPLVIQGCKL